MSALATCPTCGAQMDSPRVDGDETHAMLPQHRNRNTLQDCDGSGAIVAVRPPPAEDDNAQ